MEIKVKKLKWEKITNSYWKAIGFADMYLIHRSVFDSSCYSVDFIYYVEYITFKNLREVKKACQKDYEKFILSQIEVKG